jgi:hypothetical protein
MTYWNLHTLSELQSVTLKGTLVPAAMAVERGKRIKVVD